MSRGVSARRTAPRRTWRHLWRRGRVIVRDEGWARLRSMILAELGYHRFLLLEHWLDEPVAAIAPGVALTFGALDPAELDARDSPPVRHRLRSPDRPARPLDRPEPM